MEKIAMRSKWLLCVSAFVLCSSVYAQEFGEENTRLSDFRSIGIGAAAHRFEAAASNSLPDSLRIHFSAAAGIIEYRDLNTHIAFSYTPYTINGTSQAALSLSAESSYDIPLSRGRESQRFFFPIVISANYVEASGSSHLTQNFNIGSFGIGAGLKYRYVGDSFGAQVFGAGSILISSQGFSVETGTSTAALAEASLLLPGIIGEGVIVGYRFEIQSWRLSSAVYNYRREFQGPFVGIFF
ncbi:MAG: hypothetical protein KGJ59_10470 [Bacteroidota bacterium]|nr:hypothetical protein [Bacteroidota bacterium]